MVLAAGSAATSHLETNDDDRLATLIAYARGWTPGGSFRLGKRGVPVAIGGAVQLLLWLFNHGWVTLLVMVVIVAIAL